MVFVGKRRTNDVAIGECKECVQQGVVTGLQLNVRWITVALRTAGNKNMHGSLLLTRTTRFPLWGGGVPFLL